MKRFLLVQVLSLGGFAAFVAPYAGPAVAGLAPVEIKLPPAPLHPVVQAMNFLLDAPAPEAVGKEMKLWATYYHMPTVQPASLKSGAAPLLGKNGKAISPPLSQHDWCDAAMQGSIRIDNGAGEPTGYMFVDSDGPSQMNCDAHFGDLSSGIKDATRHARFVEFHQPKGCDVGAVPLMDYRTIAVDPSVIPLGTVLYVPKLRGHAFWLDGQLYQHDGYLVAGDRGGAIRDTHVDFLVSDAETNPIPDVISSNSRERFSAFLVAKDDPAAVAIKASEAKVCEDAPRPGHPHPKRV